MFSFLLVIRHGVNSFNWMSFGFQGTDRSREDSPELNPPPGIEDNRQCALCLTYGDDSANVSTCVHGVVLNRLTHDELFLSKLGDQFRLFI